MKTNWRLWWPVVCCLVPLAHYWAPGRTDGKTTDRPQVLDVGGLVLRDKVGNVRARLEVDSDGSPSFTLLDANNHKRIALSLSQNKSAAISLFDGKENPRLAITLPDDGSALFTGFGSKGQRVYEWSVQPDDAVQELFNDRRGSQRLGLGVGADGRTQFRICGANRQPGLWLEVAANGDARQALFDSSGNERIQFLVGPEGSGMRFLNEERRPRIATSLFKNGTAEYLVCGEDGKAQAQLSSGFEGRREGRPVWHGRRASVRHTGRKPV